MNGRSGVALRLIATATALAVANVAFAGSLGGGHIDVPLDGASLGVDWSIAQLGDALSFEARYSSLLPPSTWDPFNSGCADITPRVASGGSQLWASACSGGVRCSGFTQLLTFNVSIWRSAPG